MSPAPKRLGVLLSGRGSNFLAIAAAIQDGSLPGCEIVLVISNVEDAPGLAAARQMNLAALALPSKGVPRAQHDARMLQALQQHGVELVVLAGYMRVLSAEFLRAFTDGVLNIHPSLLPAFPGLHAQQQALDYGVALAGCTVHFVDEAVDHGVIILQRSVPVEPGDTPETLAARILHEEHHAYPTAIAQVLSGRYAVNGRRYLPIS